MKWFNESEIEKYIVHHARLVPGDKLEGRVIEIRRDSRVLIDFGKFRALAEVMVPVETGHIIRVVVESRKPKLRLRLEASADSDAFTSKPGQPVSSGAREILQSLELIAGEPAGSWEHLSMLLYRLTEIEDAAWSLFPVHISRELAGGKSNIKIKSNEKELQKISILVDTTNMGRVRVDIHVVKSEKKINITYYVNDSSIERIMAGHLPYIRQKLDPLFQQTVLHVIRSQSKIVDFDIEELEHKAGTRRVLDLKA